jgi:biopolymer transport protein ExbD
VINIISLVDVVFLLLIFFAVSTTFMREPGLNVDLPEYGSEGEEKVEDIEPTIITVAPTGEVYFDERAIRIDEIQKLIEDKRLTGQTEQVVIKADTLAQYGKVLNILKQLERAGVDSVSFAGTPEDNN